MHAFILRSIYVIAPATFMYYAAQLWFLINLRAFQMKTLESMKIPFNL